MSKTHRRSTRTLAQASRIQGVTPAAVSLLLVHLKNWALQLRQPVDGFNPRARTAWFGLDAHQASQLEALLDGVEKWNRVYNLTRITRRQDMVVLHLLDSLL